MATANRTFCLYHSDICWRHKNRRKQQLMRFLTTCAIFYRLHSFSRFRNNVGSKFVVSAWKHIFLKRIEINENPTSTSSSERVISPTDSGATCSQICIALFGKLTGSIVLLIFCGVNTVVFAFLFALSVSLSDHDFSWNAIKSCV